jgi:hypothetical protein
MKAGGTLSVNWQGIVYKQGTRFGIRGSHIGHYEEYSLVGCEVRSQPDVSEELIISTSGSNGKLSKDRSEAGNKLSSSDSEEANKFLRNMGPLSNYTTLQFRRLEH